MNKRKERVIQKTHELFIANGYHATSIQDIIHHSEISKGSFYNYFASKGEILKAVFLSVHEKLREERDALLIGEDPADIHIFAKQVVKVLEVNKESKITQLIEDALVSNEPELIDFFRKNNFLFIRWVYERFRYIFPEDKHPYLFDCAILFNGIMHTLIRTNDAIKGHAQFAQMIDYAIHCIQTIAEHMSARGNQLFSPELMSRLLPDSEGDDDFFNSEFSLATRNFRKMIEKTMAKDEEQASTCLKLVHFIREELFGSKTPRVFLIDSALLSLETYPQIKPTPEFEKYKKMVAKLL